MARKILLITSVMATMATQAFVVTIDPGHGGKFTGASGVKTGVYEKKLALDIALQLADQLKIHDIEVILTRDKDCSLDDDLMNDLKMRAHKGDTADVFISLHLNASENKSNQGFEIYIPCNEDVFPRQSYMCAGYIHHQLAHAVPAQWSGTLGNRNEVDGGIRQARFNVLARTKSKTALLVELEYLSNPDGEKRMKNASYQKAMVNAICKGLIEYKAAVKSAKD